MDQEQLKSIITTETNETIHSLKNINDGWDNQVLEINDELIFRFTRREETRKQHIKELKLLPILNNRLSLKVPNPIYHRINGEPPYYMAYKRIAGEPLTKEASKKLDQDYLIETLTNFLNELQDTPISLFKQVPVYTSETWRNQYHELYHQVMEKIAPMLEPSTIEAITEAFDVPLNEHDFFDYIPALIHRDLTSDHILHHGDQITGVIDWGDACFGDPAFDLTGFIMDYDSRLVKGLTDALEVPSHCLNRTQFYARISVFHGALYMKEIGDQKRLQDKLDQISKSFT
ncbi:MAG: aminoglycoside phosphotransferase family protein [Candidatus Bathyarchaeota archaeon]|nr:aminoglycoside phosphotransferase family protein [Candidatus Bathyarchaeota archaeon]